MINRLLDYNAVQWEDYFYLDETSPSGLRWKIPVMTGRQYSSARISEGSIAGSIFRRAGGYDYWSVGLNNKKYLVHRIIYCLLHSGIDCTLVIDHIDGNCLNNKPENLKLKTHKGNSQNVKMSSDNKSGYNGVNLYSVTNKQGKIYEYWVAQWYTNAGKILRKNFPIAKYGDTLAKELAISYRKEQVTLLNASGAEYTDRHGLKED